MSLKILVASFFITLYCYNVRAGTNDNLILPTAIAPQWTMVTNNPTKLNTDFMRVVGEITPWDKDAILSEVSKIKGIYPVIVEIRSLGDETYVPAARVIASEKFTVYLVRLYDGHWVISKVALRVS